MRFFILLVLSTTSLLAAPCQEPQVYLESVDALDEGDIRYERVLGEIPPRCLDQKQLENLVAEVRLKLETCGRFENISLEIAKGSQDQSYKIVISATPIDQFYFGGRLGALTTSALRSLERKASDQASGFFYGGYLGSFGFGPYDTGFDLDVQNFNLQYSPVEKLSDSDRLYLSSSAISLNVVQPLQDVRSLSFGVSTALNVRSYTEPGGRKVKEATNLIVSTRITARKDFYSFSPVLRALVSEVSLYDENDRETSHLSFDRWMGVEAAYKSRVGIDPTDVGSVLELGVYRRLLREDVKILGFIGVDTRQKVSPSLYVRPNMEWVGRHIDSDLYSESIFGLEFIVAQSRQVFSGVDFTYTNSYSPGQFRNVYSAEFSHSRLLFDELAAKFSLIITNSESPDDADVDPRSVQK